MPTWTNDELAKLGSAEELKIASLRRDGSLPKSVIIWVVRHGDDLYVRSVNGRTARGFVARRYATKVAPKRAASIKMSHSMNTSHSPFFSAFGALARPLMALSLRRIAPFAKGAFEQCH